MSLYDYKSKLIIIYILKGKKVKSLYSLFKQQFFSYDISYLNI